MGKNVLDHLIDTKRQIREYVDNNKNDPPLDLEHIITDILGWNVKNEVIAMDSAGNNYDMVLHVGRTEFTKENPWTLIIDLTMNIHSLAARTYLGILIGFFLEEYTTLVNYDMVGFEHSRYPMNLHEYGKVSKQLIPGSKDYVQIDDELSGLTYPKIMSFANSFFNPDEEIVDHQISVLCKENKWNLDQHIVPIYNTIVKTWIQMDFLVNTNDMCIICEKTVHQFIDQ